VKSRFLSLGCARGRNDKVLDGVVSTGLAAEARDAASRVSTPGWSACRCARVSVAGSKEIG